MVSASSHQSVRVQENTLAVLCESPAVQLGECHSQVRTLHQGQMCHVARVHNVHHTHLIVNRAQRISATQRWSVTRVYFVSNKRADTHTTHTLTHSSGVLPALFCNMRSYECNQFPGGVVVS